jgi:hypothetical protein
MHGSVLIILHKDLAKSSIESLIRYVTLNRYRRNMYKTTVIMASALAAILTVGVLAFAMPNQAFADQFAGNGGIGGAGGAGGVAGNGGSNEVEHAGGHNHQSANGGDANGGNGGNANGGNICNSSHSGGISRGACNS